MTAETFRNGDRVQRRRQTDREREHGRRQLGTVSFLNHHYGYGMSREPRYMVVWDNWHDGRYELGASYIRGTSLELAPESVG